MGASAIAMVLASGQAAAQEDTASDSAAIIVTGTRLQTTDGTTTPVPVTAVSAEALEAMAPDTLITSVSQLPQFLNNETPNSGNFFTRGGYGNLNLRGLGINRTLTLLNNRRMPSASAFGGVDINLFPQAMIQSVETVTGGASAQYGTDAVAGVVNFRINENFTGLEADAQYGVTDRGDNDNYKISGAWGTDLGDRVHVQVSGEYFNADGVHSFEGRDWYQAWGTIGAGTSASPFAFYPDVVSANATFDGVISSPSAAINGLAFDSAGNYAPFQLGSPAQAGLGAPPSRHSIANGGSGDDLNSDRFSLYPDIERYSLYGFADYEVSDDMKVFAQFIHGSTNVFAYNSPAGGSFGGTPTALTIFQDNAYLPAALRQTMVDNNIASFTLRRRGHSSDIGNNYLDDTTTQNIATAGLEWDINSGGFMDGWQADAYYQYGRSRRNWKQFGLRVDRIFAAVDAVRDANNNIVCRVTQTTAGAAAFPGCVPINLFGRGNASAAAVDYVTGNDVGEQIDTPLYFVNSGFSDGLTDSYTAEAEKVNLTTFKQQLAEVNFAGDVWDGWAGPIKLAFGGSYRKESLFQIVRDSTNRSSDHDTGRPVRCNDAALGLRGVSGADCANTVGIQYSKVWNLEGGTDVWEAYAETLVPLIDAGEITSNLSAAGRWADYSNSGSIWAYKTGIDLGYADLVRLRGTFSRDVRAPNLTERYDKTGGSATITDPFNGGATVTTTRFGGGNPDLTPEKADTLTAGIILRPSDGLSLSVDWYKVKLKDAIAQAGNQEVVNRCFAGVQVYCDLITRNSSNTIILLGDLYQNAGIDIVEGVDAELNYRLPFDVAGGDLGFRFLASWLLERSETREEFGALVTTDYAGQTGFRQRDQILYNLPDFKLTGNLTYTNGGFSAFVQGRYIDSGIQDVCGIAGRCAPNFLVYLADNTVDSVFYADMRLGYEFDLGASTAEVFANVTNLFDEDPPITPDYTAFGGVAEQVNRNVYDVLGRRFTFGVKFTM